MTFESVIDIVKLEKNTPKFVHWVSNDSRQTHPRYRTLVSKYNKQLLKDENFLNWAGTVMPKIYHPDREIENRLAESQKSTDIGSKTFGFRSVKFYSL